MTDGRLWISGLPPSLARQRRALTGLLELCESMPAVSSLSVGCSLGRGAADELSDVDAAVGVGAARGDAGAAQVREVEQVLVDHLRDDQLVDVLRDESSTGAFFIRRVFAQLVDGVQLDLAVIAEAEVRRGEAAPDFVSLYRASGTTAETTSPSAYAVTGEQVHRWAFSGWRALLDADKYLRRGSGWEAQQRLQEARQHIWALWASALGASYPWHGLSQVLDHEPLTLPDGIEATVSGIGLVELRAAVLASAAVLDHVSAAAARRLPATLPTGLAGYTRAVLARQNGLAGRAEPGPAWSPTDPGNGSA
jgi:predicted nucleotidyltransferase